MQALTETNVHLFTVGGTPNIGHASLAYGTGYSVALDNGPAFRTNEARLLQQVAQDFGDMFEISTIRKEVSNIFQLYTALIYGTPYIHIVNLTRL